MITQLIKGVPIVDKDGRPTEVFWSWAFNMTNTQLLSGSGSPEGVVEAQALRLYMDTAGTAGSILYVKKTNDVGGDRTLGWILV